MLVQWYQVLAQFVSFFCRSGSRMVWTLPPSRRPSVPPSLSGTLLYTSQTWLCLTGWSAAVLVPVSAGLPVSLGPDLIYRVQRNPVLNFSDPHIILCDEEVNQRVDMWT